MAKNYWDDENLHDNAEQLKRQASAVGKKVTPSSLDPEGKAAIFRGSGRESYSTSLEECACMDYIKHKLPCKHMYRLAFEWGVMEPNGRMESSDVVPLSSNDHEDQYVVRDTGEVVSISRMETAE